MSNCLQPDLKFEELVQRVLNEEASRLDHKTLNKTIIHDAAARRHYLEMAMLHNALGDHFGEAADVHTASGQVIPFPEKQAAGRIHSTPAPRRGIPRKHFAIAATIALLASIWALVTFSGDNAGPADAGPALYEVVSVRGADRDTVPEVGAPLHKGHIIKLNKGVVEIATNDGNNLIFQGPGELKIVEQNHLIMTSGHLLAELHGAPLTIKVPNGVITDLGTTFGILQHSRYSTRIDVFDGQVKFSHPEQESLSEVIAKGESLKSEGTDWNPVIGTADYSLYPTKAIPPLGFTCAMKPEEVSSIQSSQAYGVNWTATTQAYGSLTLINSPVQVQWVSAHTYTVNFRNRNDISYLPSAQWCGKHWKPGGREAAETMGFNQYDKGIVIQLSNIKEWLDHIDTDAYKVTLWSNAKDSDSKKALPVISLFDSSSSDIQPVVIWDREADNGQDDLISVSVRSKTLDQIFTADSITIRIPGESGTVGPSNLSAVILTPLTEHLKAPAE